MGSEYLAVKNTELKVFFEAMSMTSAVILIVVVVLFLLQYFFNNNTV